VILIDSPGTVDHCSYEASIALVIVDGYYACSHCTIIAEALKLANRFADVCLAGAWVDGAQAKNSLPSQDCKLESSNLLCES